MFHGPAAIVTLFPNSAEKLISKIIWLKFRFGKRNMLISKLALTTEKQSKYRHKFNHINGAKMMIILNEHLLTKSIAQNHVISHITVKHWQSNDLKHCCYDIPNTQHTSSQHKARKRKAFKINSHVGYRFMIIFFFLFFICGTIEIATFFYSKICQKQ